MTTDRSDEVIVAAFDTPAHAELAIQDLLAAGIPEDDVGRHVASDGEPVPDRRGFWERLFGGTPDEGPEPYDRTVASGGTVVTVATTASVGDRVSAILAEHAPVDLDERAARHAAVPPSDIMPLAFAPPLLDVPFDTSVTAAAIDAVAVARASEAAAERRLVNRGGPRVRRFVEAPSTSSPGG